MDSSRKYLTLQLARYSGIFCWIRNLLPLSALRMLYFSIIHSRLQYDIILWRSTYDYILKEVETRQNDIIQTICGKSRTEHVIPFFKQLEILKLRDLYKLEIDKFMFQLNSNKLPIPKFKKTHFKF